jgi:hypothetical protein
MCSTSPPQSAASPHHVFPRLFLTVTPIAVTWAFVAQPSQFYATNAQALSLTRKRSLVQCLLGIGERHRGVGRAESNLVGRRWEMSAVRGLLDRAIDGHGAVVGVVGPPGIGKSRLVRDLSAMASARGVEVFSTFCESHTSQIPFHAIARLLRVAFGTAWRVHDHLAGDRFDELRQLCTPAGDKASLAISMAGLVIDHALQGRMREGSQLASEAWALIESVGDATLTVGLANTVIFAKLERTEYVTRCGGHRLLLTWPTVTRRKAISLSGLR